MRVEVDFDRCQSNAICMQHAPEVFEVRDDGFLYIVDEHPPKNVWARVEEAVKHCPTTAISFVDDEAEP
jgi:ferredoxin